MTDMKKRPLWSDGKTVEDIDFYAESDADNVIYNLHEDVLCLKEDIESLRKQLATAKADAVREAANATKWDHAILCGYHSLLEYADKLERGE